jgi:hypothetical protein
MWRCMCDCGATCLISLGSLRDGNTASCGCLQKERAAARLRTHGHSPGKRGSRTYRIWCGMKTRCNNQEDHAYAAYGAKGVTVCERWHLFENFLADMGEAPVGLTLERRDNDRGYGPENCCWATHTQQARNRTNNLNITVEGVTRCAAEWSRLLGGADALVHRRIADGWDAVEACTSPVQRKFARGKRSGNQS